MNFSLTETDALCRKAAKGAGMSWGLAEEAGKSVRWLVSHRQDGPAALAELLILRETGRARGVPVTGADGWRGERGLCPIRCGASLSDYSHTLQLNEPVTLYDVHQPVLLVSFLAHIAHLHGASVILECAESALAIGPDGSLAGPVSLPPLADCKITLKTDQAAPHMATGPQTRATLSAEALEHLSRFAHRTYAPATEASRLLGAGAGTTDND